MKLMKDNFVIIKIFLFIFIVILRGQVLGKASQQTLAKIDPALKIMLARSESGQSIKTHGVEMLANDARASLPEVGVLVKATNGIGKQIENLGGKIGSVHGDIYTATVPMSAIMTLAESDHTVYIEASRRLYSDLNSSVPQTGARVLQNLAAPYNLTGKGVIVSSTDSGIDINHEDFKDAAGNTRVLYIWDQYGGGRAPTGFNYGGEYTAETINSGTCPHRDQDGHGSHVLGIAAGDGSSSGAYVGMAPEANIIHVKNRGDDIFNYGATTRGTLDGYDYIRLKATELGMPYIINTSQGSSMGPHDGTTLFEQALNNDVAAGSIIVVSAGNRADEAVHAEAIVTTDNPVTLTFTVGPNAVEDGEIELDIWFETNDQLEVEVAGPNTGFQEKVSILESRTFNTTAGRITVQSQLFSLLNSDNEIMIIIDDDGSMANQIAFGTWQVRLSAFPGNTLPDGGEIDAWFERNDPVRFTSYVDIEETLGMPSCADSAITVGSYDNTTGNISSFSSRGPRRDGVLKPEISAVGGYVISVRSANGTNGATGDEYHTQLSGTSMSAPHVTGAIALLLQLNPNLTPSQVRTIIKNSGRSDNFTGVVPNPTWGYGKMEILTYAMPQLSIATVTGSVKDETLQEPIAAAITCELLNAPFEVPAVTGFSDSLTGEFSIALMPTNYAMTVAPQLPYPVVRLDEFFAAVDTSARFDFLLNAADVLIVNDDPNGKYHEYYSAALDSLGMSYANWSTQQNGMMSDAAIQAFNSKIIIWFTGDAVTDVLNAEEQAKIAYILDQGGKLFISGQNIAEDLKTHSFLSERLHASYVSNTTGSTLDGLSGDALGDGLRLITIGQFGANNQNSRDIILPDSLAVPCFYYNTVAQTVGGIHVADPTNHSRLVFFSFGFEAINTRTGLAFATREEVLDQVIAWLMDVSSVADDTDRPSIKPAAFSLSQNYPNPFMASGTNRTTMFYHLPQQTDVTVEIYNLLGQKMKTLVQSRQSAGTYTIQWDGSTDAGQYVASGIYLYSVQTRYFCKTKKIVVMR